MTKTPLTPSMFARKNGHVVVTTQRLRGTLRFEFLLQDGQVLNLSYCHCALRLFGYYPEMGIWLGDGDIAGGLLFKGRKEFNKHVKDVMCGRLTLINTVLQ